MNCISSYIFFTFTLHVICISFPNVSTAILYINCIPLCIDNTELRLKHLIPFLYNKSDLVYWFLLLSKDVELRVADNNSVEC